MTYTIRPFKKEDWNSVSRIYKEGIATGIATFETVVPSYEDWDLKFLSEGRIVSVLNHEVVGFAILSATSQRKVYKGVVEVTVYVANEHRSKGIGKLLLNALIAESENMGIWTLQAVIFSENVASLKLHQSCGFRIVGVREKIGQLNHKWLDNILLERRSKIVGI